MGGDNGNTLNCIERIDVNDFLQSSSTTSTSKKSHWATLTIRLSTKRWGCCAVAVHNRYIVVMGGCNMERFVDIIDTSNHTVIAGPGMTVPRVWCSSAVIGHRIFVVGGYNDDGILDTVEILDFAKPCNNEERNDTLSTFISSLSGFKTHSDLVLSNPRHSCAVAAVGSCLVVTENKRTVEVLDTHRNCVWNLPQFEYNRSACSSVTLADQVAVISGLRNPSCATLSLVDRNTWCFRRLCEQPWNVRYHCHERSGNGDVNATSSTISSSTLKRLRTFDYGDCDSDKGEDVS